MRSQALRIAQLVRPNDGDDWVKRIFGPRFPGRRPPVDVKLHASRLRIGEGRIVGSRSRRQTRVAIDRFTGGAADTALFEEAPEAGGRAAIRLELRNATDADLGLVLLALKDLLDGTLAVGGTSAVGRGVLRGWANVSWGQPDQSARLEPGKPPTGPARARIDHAIQAFRHAKLLADLGATEGGRGL